jgi:hypothetical protein
MRAVEERPLKDLLWARFTSIFRKGYLWAEDSLMPQYYGRFAQVVKEFQVRSDDTWIATFPKCGTPSSYFFHVFASTMKTCSSWFKLK